MVGVGGRSQVEGFSESACPQRDKGEEKNGQIEVWSTPVFGDTEREESVEA